MLVPLLLMFGVFYFLLIRPQQKKQRRHQDMLKGLKVGDRVMTNGGIVGTIVEGGEHFVKLEIADRVRVEIGRSYIAGKIVLEGRQGVRAADRPRGRPAPRAAWEVSWASCSESKPSPRFVARRHSHRDQEPNETEGDVQVMT